MGDKMKKFQKIIKLVKMMIFIVATLDCLVSLLSLLFHCNVYTLPNIWVRGLVWAYIVLSAIESLLRKLDKNHDDA